MSIKSVFIVWSTHSRRAETLAAELKLDGGVSFLYEERLKARYLLPLRYLIQAWKSWRLLEKLQPEIVLVQSPPVFAPLIVAAWCVLHGKTYSSEHRSRYALDCHTTTWYGPRWRWAKPLMHLLAQRATITLYHNEGVQNLLQNWKARDIFLLDGVPTLRPATDTIGSEGETRVGVIGSLNPDEPIAEVFAAARLLPLVTFYVTGNQEKLKAQLLAEKPANVILTGFLHDGTYTALLQNVHGLVILTDLQQSLTCAAYEAVAMGKPGVASDWPEMRHYFSHGFVYVTNTPEAIANGIKKMLNEQDKLTTEIVSLRSELMERRQDKLEKLVDLLGLEIPNSV